MTFGEEGARRLVQLAFAAENAHSKGDPDLDQGLAHARDGQQTIDETIVTAAQLLDALVDERTIAIYALACWLDTTFPRTLVATFAARRAFEALDTPDPR